jgi:hypothetical protein
MNKLIIIIIIIIIAITTKQEQQQNYIHTRVRELEGNEPCLVKELD